MPCLQLSMQWRKITLLGMTSLRLARTLIDILCIFPDAEIL